jgi:glycosyltransferase involved in cell wall biosynthesis
VRFAVDMQRDRITHVHAHFATHPALVAFVIHRLTGIPYSFTAHGSDLHVDRRMLAEKIHAAAFAVAVSSFNKEIMVREAGEAARGKVHVIHCGVDPGFFTPAAVSRGPHGPIRLVCVASLEEVKGHRFLIEACRLLHGAGIEWQLDLVGDGPLRHRLEREVAAAGLDARVRLLGGQPRAEVARILVQADIAVLASHPTAGGKREGIPVALMEAMSCGLPVVATAISGIPELVDSGVTGLLVPSGDAAALADALRSLAADKALRERLGRAARARIVRDFDLSTSALALRDLIDGRDDRRVTVDVPVLAATGVA